MKPQTTILYHHRGSPEVLHNVLDWWAKVDTRVYLVLRLDQDDPMLERNLATIEMIVEKEEGEVNLTALIGEGSLDSVDIANELYSDDKSAHKGLVYVTDRASDLATFILVYESTNGDKR